MPIKHVRMSLLENAYDFLNEALRSAQRASDDDPHAWRELQRVLTGQLALEAVEVDGGYAAALCPRGGFLGAAERNRAAQLEGLDRGA